MTRAHQMSQLISDSRINATLEDLYRLENVQKNDVASWFSRRAMSRPDVDPGRQDAEFRRFFSDKLVALERVKAEFCFQLCRSLRAKHLVEAGTSFGVSTLYLAAALRQNLAEDGGRGMVFCAENEPRKLAAAKKNFARAGVAELIDLREGDLLTELQDLEGPLDFVLMDVWGSVPLPLIRQLHDKLRPGAVIITDNSIAYRRGYRDYFRFIRENDYTTLTLPFDGGLEYTVRNAPGA